MLHWAKLAKSDAGIGGESNADLERERREDERKVPLLGDIPALGRLFKNKSRTDQKDELLIFVTPKILQESLR